MLSDKAPTFVVSQHATVTEPHVHDSKASFWKPLSECSPPHEHGTALIMPFSAFCMCVPARVRGTRGWRDSFQLVQIRIEAKGSQRHPLLEKLSTV